jgi:DNA invertase Pin-like site-specific DNA recombinase
MTDRYAAGYLRRSSADELNPGEVSREGQEAAVRALAARDGYTGELHLFTDWNRSASEERTAQRTEFLRLLSAIERGEVSAVYSLALDRLYRSSRTFWRLTDAARAHDVRIVTAREGVLGGDGSPMATAFAEITAVFASLELNTIKARNRSVAATRRTRGDAMGQPPYGLRVVRDAQGVAIKPIAWEDDPDRPLAPVLEAYRRAGTVLGATKILNAAGIKPPRDGQDFQNTTLTLILDRAGVLPPRNHRAHFSSGAVLAGLLRCHCGRTMTPSPSRNDFYCGRAKLIGAAAHGRMTVPEGRILPIIEDEVARLSIPYEGVEIGRDDPALRDSLAERRRRLALTFADGALDEATYRAELAALEVKVERIEAAAEIVLGPRLDWSAPTADVNAALRKMFEYVQLDAEMKVTEIVWKVPEFRA